MSAVLLVRLCSCFILLSHISFFISSPYSSIVVLLSRIPCRFVFEFSTSTVWMLFSSVSLPHPA